MNKTRSLTQIFGYSFGECANSLVMNGLFGFAMLYYTDALGLPAALAGMAMSVSVFWEAITDPVMGHISDRTCSRFGRRLPWMMIGGLMMAVCFFFVWAVPGGLRGNPNSLFWYLVVMNLLLRTGLTMFFIPYMALGFELVTDYHQRTTLQSLRQVFNMAANFAGPAMAWTFFFRDQPGAEPGSVVKGTSIPSNFIHMGTTFAIATVVFVVIVVAASWSRKEDSRNAPAPVGGSGIGGFIREMKEIIGDPHPRWVFVFIFVVASGMVLVSSLQMYVYVHFMQFSPEQKSIAHGSTMIGMALGALLSIGLVRRLDKRGAVIFGGLVSVVANVGLAVFFLSGLLPVGTSRGGAPVLSLTVFVLFHAAYWLGNGILLPVSNAMMADVSEVNLLRTGVNKDGGYAAVFSLALRLAISFSLMVSGWVLNGIGFVSGPDKVQSASTVWWLGLVMFVIGAIIALVSLAAIRRYRVNRSMLENLRAGAEG